MHNDFRDNAVEACLDHCDIGMGGVDKILLGYDLDLLQSKSETGIFEQMRQDWENHSHPLRKGYHPIRTATLTGWGHIKGILSKHVIKESDEDTNPLLREIKNRLKGPW